MVRKSAVGPVILSLVGLASGFATLMAGVTGSNVDWLATGFLVIISAGLVTTGGLGIVQPRDGNLYHHLPATTLIVLGISLIFGGLVAFNPGGSTVNRGLQLMLMGVLVLTGIGLVLVGWRWARERQMSYPLGILAGGLVLGLAYLIHQMYDVFYDWPAMLLIISVAVLITVAIAYAVPARIQSI